MRVTQGALSPLPAMSPGWAGAHPDILLHLQQDPLVLLGDGQRGTVHALVDLLALLCLEGVKTFPRVTHPAETAHKVSLWSLSQGMIKNIPPGGSCTSFPCLSTVPMSPPWR